MIIIKNIKKLVIPLLFMFVISSNVYAENKPVDTYIPVDVNIENANGSEKCSVSLSSSEDSPLPETRKIEVTNSGQIKFGPITFTKPGDYTYNIYQDSSNFENKTTDSSVYKVIIQVLSDESGVLTTNMSANLLDKGKVSSISFNNKEIKKEKEKKETEKEKETTSTEKPQQQAAANDKLQTGDNQLNSLIYIVGIVACLFILGILLIVRKQKE